MMNKKMIMLIAMLFYGNSTLICNANEGSVALTTQQKEKICSQMICLFNNNDKNIKQQDIALFCKTAAINQNELVAILKEKKELLFPVFFEKLIDRGTLIAAVATYCAVVISPFAIGCLQLYMQNKTERAIEAAQNSYMAFKHACIDQRPDMQEATQIFEQVYGKYPYATSFVSHAKELTPFIHIALLDTIMSLPIPLYVSHAYFSAKTKKENITAIDAIIEQIEHFSTKKNI